MCNLFFVEFPPTKIGDCAVVIAAYFMRAIKVTHALDEC